MTPNSTSNLQENQNLVQSLFKGFYNGLRKRGYSDPTARREVVSGSAPTLCARVAEEILSFSENWDKSRNYEATEDFKDSRNQAINERLEGLAAGLAQKGESVSSSIMSIQRSLRQVFVSAHNHAEVSLMSSVRDTARQVQRRESPLDETLSKMGERLASLREERPQSSPVIAPPSSTWSLS